MVEGVSNQRRVKPEEVKPPPPPPPPPAQPVAQPAKDDRQNTTGPAQPRATVQARQDAARRFGVESGGAQRAHALQTQYDQQQHPGAGPAAPIALGAGSVPDGATGNRHSGRAVFDAATKRVKGTTFAERYDMAKSPVGSNALDFLHREKIPVNQQSLPPDRGGHFDARTNEVVVNQNGRFPRGVKTELLVHEATHAQQAKLGQPLDPAKTSPAQYAAQRNLAEGQAYGRGADFSADRGRAPAVRHSLEYAMRGGGPAAERAVANNLVRDPLYRGVNQAGHATGYVGSGPVPEGKPGSHAAASTGRVPGAPGAALRGVQLAGRIATPVAAAVDVYSVATSDDKVKAATEKGAAWAGAIAGAKGGATIGATVGTFVGGPIGTAVGGAVGGLIGGAAGYFAGEKIGEKLAPVVKDVGEAAKNVVEKLKFW